MKKHRTNSFSTLVYHLLEIGLPFCIVIPIMIYIFGGDKYTTGDIFSTIPLTFFGMLFMAAFFSALNLLTIPFKKPSVILEEGYLLHKETRVDYDEVDDIVINSGLIAKYTRFEPCTLELYSKSKLLAEIKSPSFFMMLRVILRCKNARLRYWRYKRAIIICVCEIVFSVIIGLVS